MNLGVAVLCDRATVREGLLHLLGGGVTTCTIPSLPAGPELDLALILNADDGQEFAGTHKVHVSLVAESDEMLVGMIELGWEAPDVVETDELPSPSVPMSVPLRLFAVTRYGFYNVMIELDGNPLGKLRFLIRQSEPTLAAVTPQL